MSNAQQFAMICLATLFLAGCGGAPSTETMKLGQPVNIIMQSNAGEPAQVAAANALGRIGQPAVPALTDALSDGNPVVRYQAARALTFMGAQATTAVPALERALHDSDEAVRQQSALALGQIGNAAAPAVPSLVQMLKLGNSAPTDGSGVVSPPLAPPTLSPGLAPPRQP